VTPIIDEPAIRDNVTADIQRKEIMSFSPKSLIAEFKAFALKGNMIDLAVGLIIGAAFGAMVTSLVKDVISPPLGYLMGGLDFKDKVVWLLQPGAIHPITDKPIANGVAIAYGSFINALIAFSIQAFAIFLVVKAINKMRRKEEAAPSLPPTPTKEETLLTEIRDILKANAGKVG
jgi:large conductance mechanosensitive channel